MSKRAYKKYTREFKVEASRLAEVSDQPMTQVARKLGLRVNQIYKWTKQLEGKHGDTFSGKQTATDKDAKIQRLNKALAAHTQAELNKVAKRLNQRPRKTLGYRTPGDTLNDSVALKA